jgi:hypothetical protein
VKDGFGERLEANVLHVCSGELGGEENELQRPQEREGEREAARETHRQKER